MLARTRCARAVNVAWNGLTGALPPGHQRITAPLGELHFADRAVKATAARPQFVCLYQFLAAQSPHGSAAVSLRAPPPPPPPLPAGTAAAADPAPRTSALVQLQGDCVVCVLRSGRLAFQCYGDAAAQSHELSLAANDTVVLLTSAAGIDGGRRPALWRVLVGLSDEFCHGDIEYAAEELLLSLPAGEALTGSSSAATRSIGSGRTTLVGRIAPYPTVDAEPPYSSQSIA